VCDFDFAEVYGPLGHGVAECPHRIPIKEARGEYRLRLRDLAIVCANCHLMLHKTELTVEGLRCIVRDLRAFL
jgi:predicted HNH restriction endonuclease